MEADKKNSLIESSQDASDGGQVSPQGPESVPYVDPILEKSAMRKFDRWAMPQFGILILIAYLDRTNIGNAKVFGFEEDLNLKDNEYGNLAMLFYVTYVAFETPWVIAIKRFGANRIIALCFVLWSAVTIGTGFIRNYHQGIAARLLLGAFESGCFPCLVFMISTIYTREQQGKRIAVLYAASALSGAFGGLIAYGIQLMGYQAGLEAWRWLFIIEGAASMVLCALCVFSLPKNAETAWFLTQEERLMMAARKQRDLIFKGDDNFSWSHVKDALVDPVLYVIAIPLFANTVTQTGIGTFLPTIIKGFGYTPLEANYLTIPVYLFACTMLCLVLWVSDKYRTRGMVAMIIATPIIVGYAITVATPNGGAGYFAMFLCAGGIFPLSAVIMSWIANNIKPDYKRSTAVPLSASIACCAGLVSSQIYPSVDGPRYLKGNAISLGMAGVALIGLASTYLIWRFRNLKKKQLLDQGVTDNGKTGDRALDFMYIL